MNTTTVPPVSAEEATLLEHTLGWHMKKNAPLTPSHGQGAETPVLPSDGAALHGEALAAHNGRVTDALYSVLVRYVAMLEHPEHGGWSQEEDATVQQAVDALVASGMKLHSMPRAR